MTVHYLQQRKARREKEFLDACTRFDQQRDLLSLKICIEKAREVTEVHQEMSKEIERLCRVYEMHLSDGDYDKCEELSREIHTLQHDTGVIN